MNHARFGGKWRAVTFGEIGKTYGGLSGKTSTDFGRGHARYISFLDVIEQATVTWRQFDRVRVSCSESQNRVVSGDVLFNATSETPDDLAMGSMAVVDSDELYLNSFCFGFRIADRNRCDPLFLAYFTRGGPGRNAMYALAQGATRYNLSKKRFLRIQIPLPAFPEQRAIAAVLSDVDELIGSLEALIAKKRAIKRAAMQELLTGRTRLPGFGGAWRTRRLEEVALVTMGQSPPSASYNAVGDGLPLIQGNADVVGRTTIDRIWTTLPSKRCGAGDIVLTVRAPVGSVARASKGACLGRGVCGLKPLGHGLFLYYALILRESRWEDVEQGSTFSAANSAQVAGFPIAVPMDKLEQQAIATVLSDMDSEIAALDHRLDKTRAIKQGMMQQLLTGSIRLPIPNADTEDAAHDA